MTASACVSRSKRFEAQSSRTTGLPNDIAFSGGAQPARCNALFDGPTDDGTRLPLDCLFLRVRTVALGIILVAILLQSKAQACSPCGDDLDLRATAIRAGLVVVAHRIGEDFSPASGDEQWVTFATFEVQKVLKGSPIGQQIDVAMHWMCGMGPDVERGRSAVLFLERRKDRYYTVRDGCAVRSLPIVDGKAVLSDLALPIDVLATNLGFAWAGKNREPWWTPALFPAVLGIVAAALGFAVGRRSRR